MGVQVLTRSGPSPRRMRCCWRGLPDPSSCVEHVVNEVPRAVGEREPANRQLGVELDEGGQRSQRAPARPCDQEVVFELVHALQLFAVWPILVAQLRFKLAVCIDDRLVIQTPVCAELPRKEGCEVLFCP